MQIKQQKFIMLFALVIVVSIYISSLTMGHMSGATDSNASGACSSGCHTTQGNATVEMWATGDTVMVGETVTVYVNVTSWILTSNKMIGVFLLKSLTASTSDLPSNDGWRILTDPNGNTFNYVEKVAVDVGVTTSFRWDLRAPFSAGTYQLYARVHYGGAGPLWHSNTTGLTFEVFPDVTVKPDLVLIDVFSYSEVVAGKQTVLYATVYNNHSDNVDGIDVDFLVDGEVVSQISNQTIRGKKVRNATVTWLPTESGNVTLSAVLDPLDSIEESDETNNEASSQLQIVEPEKKPTPRFDILGFLLIVLVVFVAGIAVIGVMRRKEDEDEEDNEEEMD